MDFLEPALVSAFSMINVAAQQLGNPAQINSRVSRLRGYIFGDTWVYASCNYFRLFKTRRCGLANEYQGRFNNLSQYGWASDILIYCDQTRLEQNPEGLWVDTKNNYVYDGSSNMAINACEKDPGTAGHTVSHTDIKHGGTALMQLCPWYMKYLLNKIENNEFVYITPDALIRARDLSTRPPLSPLIGPQIDYFVLLDQVILHEVCITSPAPTNKADHDFEVHLLILLPLS
jgi:hypothetical protein